MIKINNVFSAEHDGKQWVLFKNKFTTDRDGEERVTVHKSYFYSLEQVARNVINELGEMDAKNIKKLIKTYKKLINVLAGNMQQECKDER